MARYRVHTRYPVPADSWELRVENRTQGVAWLSGLDKKRPLSSMVPFTPMQVVETGGPMNEGNQCNTNCGARGWKTRLLQVPIISHVLPLSFYAPFLFIAPNIAMNDSALGQRRDSPPDTRSL